MDAATIGACAAAATAVIGTVAAVARLVAPLFRRATPAAVPLDRRVVLVVDDEILFRRLMIRMLSSIERVTVDTADGYAEGLAALTGPTPPTVAVVDLGLPGGDGAELARRARKAHPATVIVLVSGSVSDGARGDMADENEVMSKFDTLAIRARVVAALR